MTLTRPRRRKLVAVAALALSVATLTGCSTLSYEEAQAAEHRVIETSNNLLGGRSWAYIGPSGVEVPLTEDCRDGFFGQTCRASADGSVEFRYSKYKSKIRRESITVDGEQYDANCVREFVFDSNYVCAPTN